MRIGIELAKVANGGGERILSMLAQSFSERGHSVVIFTWNKSWELEDIPYTHELYILKKIPTWGNGISSTLELARLVKDAKVDCLISFLNTPLRIFVGAAKINHIPVITSLRVEPVFDTFIKKVMKAIMWCCDGEVFQTHTVRNSFTGRIFKNSIVIHNPIMDDNLPFVDFDNREKVIVGIGRLTEQKNFALLIDAFAELRPKGYKLKIYGEGHLRDSLTKQIEELNVSDQVMLMGHVDRVVNYIANADMFVLSSDWEGMPNALMEAMAMGLACVATDVATGGSRDLIKEGENGLLVPVGNKEAMKDAIKKIIENEAFKKHIMKNAFKIRDSHSKEVIIPQWISFVESKCTKQIGYK